jgi:hypothetical protein
MRREGEAFKLQRSRRQFLLPEDEEKVDKDGKSWRNAGRFYLCCEGRGGSVSVSHII